MPSPGAYVTDVEAKSVRKNGRKYEYVITTIWSDGGRFEIYRRYAEFFVFQSTLLKLYPKEAGKYEEKDRVIPFLPNVDNAFKLFGRTNSETIMKQRLTLINFYCKTILLKHPVIGRGDHALNFFRPSPSDKQLRRLGKPMSLHPQRIPSGNMWEEHVLLADFVPDMEKKAQQLEAKAGERVLVMRKDESGWFLCSGSQGKKTGWIPESYLKKYADDSLELGDVADQPKEADVETKATSDSDSEDSDNCLPCYRAIDDYETDDAGQVSFAEGDILLVIDQDEDGWWFVKHNMEEGWAPSSYLEPEEQTEQTSKELADEIQVAPVTISVTVEGQEEEGLSVYYAKREYQSQLEDELSFPTGAKITVISKSISGWWTARYGEKLGLVPATYLSEDPVSTEPEVAASKDEDAATSNSLVPKYSRPPPRRKTVRQTVLQKRKMLNL